MEILNRVSLWLDFCIILSFEPQWLASIKSQAKIFATRNPDTPWVPNPNWALQAGILILRVSFGKKPQSRNLSVKGVLPCPPPSPIVVNTGIRAQWDLSRKVNLKLEELAYLFFNVKLNFKVGFFWIFFDLSTPWGRKMHICKCMGISMGKWPK